MTTLESRVASLEHDMAVVAAVLTNVATQQTLFTSVASEHLRIIGEKLDQIRRGQDDSDDEWESFR